MIRKVLAETSYKRDKMMTKIGQTKVFGQKAADAIGWWQNKCIIKAVMALKGAIYDTGGALTGVYAKEIALTKGYKYLFNVWLF